jgi:hypothetical protein
MSSINSQADVMTDWKGLMEASDRSPEVQQLVAPERQALGESLVEVETLKARQMELTAQRQEVTQQLKDAVKRGKVIAIQIRSMVRGKIGPLNERLVHFRVAPIRARSSRKRLPRPDDGGTETVTGAAVPPPAKPVA